VADHDTLKSGIEAVADGDYKCFDIGSNTITAASQITTNSGGSAKAFSSTGDGVIPGRDATRIFYVVSGSTLDLESLTIKDGNAGADVADAGGAVFSDGGALNAKNVVFKNNRAPSHPCLKFQRALAPGLLITPTSLWD